MAKRIARIAANTIANAVLWMFAAVCAALPFYVHLHPDQFGPPVMVFSGAQETGNQPQEVEQARGTNALLRSRLQLDQIMTGSIEPLAKPTSPRVIQPKPQPFPGDSDQQSDQIEFISATSRRALAVVDGRWVIFVAGDRLPDGRVIAGFDLSNKVIEAITEDPASSAGTISFPDR